MSHTIIPPGKRPGLDPRDALDILEIRSRQPAGAELAGHKDAGPDVLHYLAANGATATRAAVAANSATTAATDRLLADDSDADVRAELAAKIARIMPGLSERESSHIHALTIETLECLARDAAVKVRAVLAEAIKSLDCIPRDVVMTLARDVNGIVSAPILEYSPLLSGTDLMEIIACGQVSAALSAIARRKPISAEVCDRLVKTLDVPAVAALLANADARIRKETLDRIVEDAAEVSDWHMPLALRADLSARAIRRIAGFVGATIISQLVARNDLSETTRARLAKELRARLAETEFGPAQDHDAFSPAEAVAEARDQGHLDGLFVEQAAQRGQREIVTLALAGLANVSEATVKRIFSARRAKPVVALVWHAHLSMRVAFKIQTQLLKLPGHEVLPAKGGVGFPMPREEMRWHLSYFDIPV